MYNICGRFAISNQQSIISNCRRVFTLCKTALCIALLRDSRALSAQTIAYRASNNRPVRQPRPRRLDNRNSRASECKASSSLECSAECSRESTKLTFYCVKHSQFYCVDNHEQPLVGESLFASTEQPVYRLSPPS